MGIPALQAAIMEQETGIVDPPALETTGIRKAQR
jgi:hypothetical protein